MAKKVSILLLVGLSWLVLMGHAVVPHHHDEEKIAVHHQQGNDDGDHDDSPLSEAFSHFHHYDVNQITYCNCILTDRYHQSLDDFILLEISNLLISTHSQKAKEIFLDKPKIYLPAGYYSIPSLRGPPFLS
jgi:hypothetical protein